MLTIAAIFSLLLAGLVILLWARSYRHLSGPAEADSLDLTHADPYWWIISNPGQLTFCHQVGKDWNSPTPKLRFLGVEFAGSWVGDSSLVNLFIPYWLLLLPLMLAPTYRFRAGIRDRAQTRRLQLGLCRQCGYDLRSSSTRCPECGAQSPSS